LQIQLVLFLIKLTYCGSMDDTWLFQIKVLLYDFTFLNIFFFLKIAFIFLLLYYANLHENAFSDKQTKNILRKLQLFEDKIPSSIHFII
jgi:hypothetical protein